MRILIIFTLFIVTEARSVRAEPLDNPGLLAAVESLARQFSDGIATFTGGEAVSDTEDPTSEGRVAVLFGLTSWAGGNGSRQFLAVFNRHVYLFESGGRRLRPYRLIAVVQVGEDSNRWFKTIEWAGERIVLTGGRWLPTDAHCCPSATATATYQLIQWGLVELEQ